MNTKTSILKDVFTSKKLVWTLSKNDFKQKFAGSYFGIIWAFVQPVITILVYWIVFDKALNAGTQSTKAGIEAPYVLWLSAGIVPWFYFSEVLGSGTNALVEYNYLVKKVVFKISTLPVVKAVSSLFVHLFFIAFTLFLFFLYGYKPSIYMIQVIYYSFAMMVLIIGLIYATSAMVVFFRDLSQVITIVLQVGIWATPIMWNFDAVVGKIPKWLGIILQINPMYYISNGYRDSLLNKVWFWEHPWLTLCYWAITIIFFALGTHIFKKLQPQFADVL